MLFKCIKNKYIQIVKQYLKYIKYNWYLKHYVRAIEYFIFLNKYKNYAKFSYPFKKKILFR